MQTVDISICWFFWYYSVSDISTIYFSPINNRKSKSSIILIMLNYLANMNFEIEALVVYSNYDYL